MGAQAASLNPVVPPPSGATGFFHFLTGTIAMKIISTILLLVVCLAGTTIAAEYDTSYCHDPAELQKWEQMLTNNPDSEPLAAIHALWIGLCVKVEARQLTTIQANRIFERFRNGLLDLIQQQHTAHGRQIISFCPGKESNTMSERPTPYTRGNVIYVPFRSSTIILRPSLPKYGPDKPSVNNVLPFNRGTEKK